MNPVPTNKGNLVSLVAAAGGFSQAQAKVAVDAVFDSITKSLKKKKVVTIVGFGSFSVVGRKARIGRNPQTGESIKIKASNAPKFKPGKSLKDAVKK